MPVYEFECDICGFTTERFYPSIPRTTPMQIRGGCRNCGETDATFKKVLSLSAFHLKPGGVGWGAEKYSSSAVKGTDIVSIDEP